ncbi:MAG: CTP synthase, partial [Planctomycetes bacterium]|nr:CTP synthase [Planctomycetota bacterium]
LSIYEVPMGLADHKLDQLIIEKQRLDAGRLEIDDWRELMQRIRHPEHEVTIAVVGKYIEHRDAYKSIYEALDHAGIAHSTRVLVKRIESEHLESEGPEMLLRGVDGILVPGGFGTRGTEGKIEAVRFAREMEIPYFGICLGMQCAVIEFARHVLGHAGANSTEFAADTPHPVICILEEQKAVTHKGGTMRLGGQPCTLREDSRSAWAYDTIHINERHRHRYELNPEYLAALEAAGLAAVGRHPAGMVEVIEIPEHPWFVAVQFHPEFKSKPLSPHPLFGGFVEAALERHRERMHVGV